MGIYLLAAPCFPIPAPSCQLSCLCHTLLLNLRSVLRLHLQRSVARQPLAARDAQLAGPAALTWLLYRARGASGALERTHWSWHSARTWASCTREGQRGRVYILASLGIFSRGSPPAGALLLAGLCAGQTWLESCCKSGPGGSGGEEVPSESPLAWPGLAWR